MKKKDRSKKLYLYSGHDNTVSAFLSTLNLLQQHQPAYTAAVIVELHEPLKRKTSRFAGPQDYFVKVNPAFFIFQFTFTPNHFFIDLKSGNPF